MKEVMETRIPYPAKLNKETTLIYDGSFNGFLTAVFIAFEKRLNVVDIQKNNKNQQSINGAQRKTT